MIRNRITNGQNDRIYVDVVQDEGSTDFVKNGRIYKDYPAKSVMVASESDLSYLANYTPGTIAYTAGYEHIWQKSVTDEWVSIV